VGNAELRNAEPEQEKGHAGLRIMSPAMWLLKEKGKSAVKTEDFGTGNSRPAGISFWSKIIHQKISLSIFLIYSGKI
jgi:hypothetical protein